MKDHARFDGDSYSSLAARMAEIFDYSRLPDGRYISWERAWWSYLEKGYWLMKKAVAVDIVSLLILMRWLVHFLSTRLYLARLNRYISAPRGDCTKVWKGLRKSLEIVPAYIPFFDRWLNQKLTSGWKNMSRGGSRGIVTYLGIYQL